MFLIEMNRKQINIPKLLRFSWLRAEGFKSLFQQLNHQRLKSFLELSGKIYLDLVKVIFTNLEFKNDVLLSSIKGVQMEINKKAWKDVVGLKSRGVRVRKGEIGAVDESLFSSIPLPFVYPFHSVLVLNCVSLVCFHRFGFIRLLFPIWVNFTLFGLIFVFNYF